MYGLWGHSITPGGGHVGQSFAPSAMASRDEQAEANDAVAEEYGGREDDEYDYDGDFAARDVVGQS